MRSLSNLTRVLLLSAAIPWLCVIALSTLMDINVFSPRAAWGRMAEPPNSVRFAVIGDYGNQSAQELAIADMIRTWNVDFVTTAGDNNYPDGAASTIDGNIGRAFHDFIYPYVGTRGPGARYNKFWPALGNHDWSCSGCPSPYQSYFTLPGNERYYNVLPLASDARTQKLVHLFIVDSDTHEPDGTSSTSIQGQWLQNALASSDAPWKIVLLHHPPYSSSSTHGSSSWMQWPFQQWGASAVIAGHDHTYERIVLNNFPYFVNGLGGASRYSFGRTVPGSVVRYNADWGAQLVEADANHITFQFFTQSGELIDSFTMTSGQTTPVPTSVVSATATAVQTSTTAVPTNTRLPTNTRTHTSVPTVTPTNRPGTYLMSFNPESDSYVEEVMSDTNRGISTTLLVDGAPNMQSYLRFTVSGISDPVIDAKIRLYAIDGSVDGPALYSTANNWSETGVTWSNRPATTGTPIDDIGPVTSRSWIEFNLETVVRGQGTYSFALIPTSGDGVDMYSREGSVPPQLVLTLASDDTPTSTSIPGTAIPTRTSLSTSTAVVTRMPSNTPQSQRAYYVDDLDGSDSNSGTSETDAWLTLDRASNASLLPGDSLLLKRGGVWTGSLSISSSGTITDPITISAYGTGGPPRIEGGSTCVNLVGSYLALQSVVASSCGWAGIGVTGRYNLIQNSISTNNVAGIFVRTTAFGTRILNNVLWDNNRMSVLTPDPLDDDSGAFSVLVQGDNTEVAYNRISGSDAFSYDYGRDGSAVEIYGGKNNFIHHNLAYNNNTFTELGNSRSSFNTYAYNLVRSSLTNSTFLVTRGALSSYGPVLLTKVYNNTVAFTGSASQGFICHAGCSRGILTMNNNIIQAVWKVGYADGVFNEDHDLFYGGILQFTRGPHSIVANPMFVNPTMNLHLQSTSPAIDRGVHLGYTGDWEGAQVPQDGDGDGQAYPDMGAYEFQP